MRNCVTHHMCDCTRDKIELLEKKLAISTEALQKYAGNSKWTEWIGREYFIFDGQGGLCPETAGALEAKKALAEIKALDAAGEK